MYNTKAFIEALSARLNQVLPTYFEEAPERATSFPYAVINGIKITDLAQGDLMLFYVDLWGDEKSPTATVTLEEYCDALRNELSGAVIASEGAFGAHVGFEGQTPLPDSEHDIAHRRLSLSARIFYN